LPVDFQGARLTSDGGLILVRELDERLGLSELMDRQVATWSLTSVQQRLVKTGGRLSKHARHYWLLLVERRLARRLFADILGKIAALQVPAG
jgi:hypothetical protein